MKRKNALEIYREAHEAGYKAGLNCMPRPMTVVERENPFDSKSEIKNQWHVPDGVCGFAWVKVPGNSWFIRELKKKGLASGNYNGFSREVFRKASYGGGYTYWVSEHNQSYERKSAHAHAFADVLQKYGIKAYAMSRLD